ncbi:transposable element Tcb2 transposase [Trichonephila clavipes]|nr:transposable element Tcb2 transposase [Trichonephila clavipes]
MLPDNQYQVDQESQPLTKTDICLSRDSGRVTLWRERGTRFEPRNITERHHFPLRGVMVWAGIMMDIRTDLHFFDTGSVTTQRYRDGVLEPYVCLFRGAVNPDFIFMDDNEPCHRAVLIDDFLEMENIQRMSWPADSPDLNSIEHVWDMFGRLAALSHPPSSVTELKKALQEAWNRLSPQLIHHLIARIYSQFGLAIHQNDHQARRRFVEWAQNEIAVVPDFHKRILFSDEAHFWLNGYVKKQNCRIWSEANPQVYVETPLHPEKLTVWCALWAGGIIGPYFFKNDEGQNVIVNGDLARAV